MFDTELKNQARRSLVGLILGIAFFIGLGMLLEYINSFQTTPIIADTPHETSNLPSPSLIEENLIIWQAAKRNGLSDDDYILLLAIRKSENGGDGKEFGVKHPKAWNTDLNTQARWAAATVKNHHNRFGRDEVTDEFIISLCDRYCPPCCDPEGNVNLKNNVQWFYGKYKKESE